MVYESDLFYFTKMRHKIILVLWDRNRSPHPDQKTRPTVNKQL